MQITNIRNKSGMKHEYHYGPCNYKRIERKHYEQVTLHRHNLIFRRNGSITHKMEPQPTQYKIIWLIIYLLSKLNL